MADKNHKFFLVALWGALAGCSEGGVASGALNYCDDVRPIVAEKCVRCHADPPKNGAPFSLTTYEQFQKPHPTATELEIGELAIAAIESGRMPATSIALEPAVLPLTKEEKEILLEWLDSKRVRGDCTE